MAGIAMAAMLFFNIPSWCLLFSLTVTWMFCVNHLSCAYFQMKECLTLTFSLYVQAIVFEAVRKSWPEQWEQSKLKREIQTEGRAQLTKTVVSLCRGYIVRSSGTSVTYHVLVVHRSCNHSYLAVIVFLHFQVKYFYMT